MFDLQTSAAQSEIVRRWNGLGGRLAMLMTHYRLPIDWTTARHLAARSEIMDWHEQLKKIGFQHSHGYKNIAHIVEALANDLSTSEAITMLREASKAHDLRVLGEGMDLLGLFDKELSERYDLTVEQLNAPIQRLVYERLSLIAAKNWAEADRIRDELLAQGIQLKDGKDPATGERITTWEVKR